MSSENEGELELGAVTRGDGRGSGVPHGDALVALVDAALGRDDEALAAARAGVVEAVGTRGLVDAAGVIATFTMQNRIVDAVGVPLDAPMELATRGVRQALGVEEFGGASRTPRGGWILQVASWLASRLMPMLLRWMGRRKPKALESAR